MEVKIVVSSIPECVTTEYFTVVSGITEQGIMDYRD